MDISERIIQEMQSIHGELQSINNRLTGLENGQTRLEREMVRLDNGQEVLKQEVSDMRHTQTLFEQNMTQQFGAINDQFNIVRSIGEESMSVLKETKALLDEDIEEKVTTGATVIDIVKRVNILEKQAM